MTASTLTPTRPPHRLGMILAYLALNLAGVLALSAPQALPAPVAAYLEPGQMVLSLAVMDFAFALLLLPVFLHAPAPTASDGEISLPNAGGRESSTGRRPDVLAAIFQRGAWATALYHAATLTLLALPFLALASRVAPLPPGALAATLGSLLVLTADLALLALLAGRWYYPIVCAVSALPPLVDYLAADVLQASSTGLVTLSPVGVLLAAAHGGQLSAAGLSASRGTLVYALIFLALAVLAPVPAGGVARRE